MSQLGMMVIAVGLSSYNVALFHLINHAFYKGLLFLGAGAVIHAVADNQDFRKYGGLISFLPLSYSVIFIASLSLVAFPFMTGFYSKDFILESAYGQYSFSGTAIYIIAVIGAIFTTLYSVKVLYLTFLSNPNGPITSYKHAHEGDMFISIPLIILAIFSIFFGFITKDIFIGLGSNFFIDNSIFIHPIHEIMINTEFAVPTIFKLLPFIFTMFFSLSAILCSEFFSEQINNFKLSKLGYSIFGFFNQRFLIELFYNKYITNLVLSLGGQTTKILDKGSIEGVGPYGLEKVLIKTSKNISNLNTSVIPTYALYILISFTGFICFGANFLSFNLILFLILIIFNTQSKNNNKEKMKIATLRSGFFLESFLDPNLLPAVIEGIISIFTAIGLFASKILFGDSQQISKFEESENSSGEGSSSTGGSGEGSSSASGSNPSGGSNSGNGSGDGEDKDKSKGKEKAISEESDLKKENSEELNKDKGKGKEKAMGEESEEVSHIPRRSRNAFNSVANFLHEEIKEKTEILNNTSDEEEAKNITEEIDELFAQLEMTEKEAVHRTARTISYINEEESREKRDVEDTSNPESSNSHKKRK
jgi:NADH-ubiquinone oxidoreductase chain 5